MTRFPDWPERLAAFVEARRRAAFRWGTNDCAIFAADAVLELTGVDLARSWRGYSTEAQAAQLIEAAGGMRRLVTLPERPIGHAQRGDVVLASHEGRETLGIVLGNRRYAAPGHRGAVFRPMSEVLATFEV